MSSRKPARTARRLLKVASLGIAGLIAGLLGGCSSDSVARFSTWHSESTSTLTANRRIENLDYRRTPEFRRAPVPHHGTPYQPQQRTASTAQASLGEIDALGHHYNARYGGQ